MNHLRHILSAALLVLLLAVPGRDIHAQAWTTVAPMPTPRAGLAAVVLDGQVYTLGGRDGHGEVLDAVEAYDPATDTWTTALPALHRARYNAAAVVWQDQILVIGGRDKNGNVLRDVEALRQGEDRWRTFRDLDDEREGHAAVVLNGTVYVIGGSDDDGDIIDDIAFFDTARDRWEEVDDWELDQPRASLAVGAVDGAAYVLGGFTRLGPWGPVQRFKPGESPTTPTTMPVPRGGLAAASRGQQIWAIGGRNTSNQVVRLVSIFDASTNTWRGGPSLGQGRENPAVAVAAGGLYVFGGFDLLGQAVTDTERLQLGSLPTAIDDTAEVDEDTAIAIHVVANDADPEGRTLQLVGFTQPTRGHVTEADPGVLRYTPEADFFGTDTFTYTVTDGEDGEATATVTVTVRPVNDAPRFSSAPRLQTLTDTLYTYAVVVDEPDGDAVTLSAPEHPDWMTFTDHGDGTATLRGTPTPADTGTYQVVIRADDGLLPAEQRFTLVVTTPTGVSAEALPRASVPWLDQNYPNPFATTTTIAFEVPSGLRGRTVLEVYDLQGRRVATLVDAVLPPGPYTVTWAGQTDDRRLLASGRYLYRLRQGGTQVSRTLVLVR